MNASFLRGRVRPGPCRTSRVATSERAAGRTTAPPPLPVGPLTSRLPAPASRVSAWESVGKVAEGGFPACAPGDDYAKGLAAVGSWLATPEGRECVAVHAREDRNRNRRDARRDARYERQRALWPLLPEAMRKCHRVRFNRAGVQVVVDVNGAARVEGLCSCHRRSGCPHCMPALLARDAELVNAMVERHGYDRTLMATFTMRHHAGCSLRALRQGLACAFQDVRRHRIWRAFRQTHGVRTIRVVEVTHGRNGWHVHLHVLLLTNEPIAGTQGDDLRRMVARLWQRCVTQRMGARHRPTIARGVKLTQCYRADYLTKLGLEIADAAQSKVGRGKGRTYEQLARDWIAAGRDVQSRDARLIREFIDGMAGAKIVTWDHGMKAEAEALAPERKAEPRESAATHAEEYDAIRDRVIEAGEGRVVDGRVFVLRAAESAREGDVQAAVDEAVGRILREGVRVGDANAQARPGLHRARAGPAP